MMTSPNGWLSAQARLVLLMSLSIAAVLIETIPSLFLIYLLSVGALLLSRPKPRNVAFLVLLSAAAAWGFVMTQMFFYPFRPRTQLFQLIDSGFPVIGPLTGGVSIYLEGVIYGLAQSLRFLAMLTAGLTVVWSTSSHRLLTGLRMLRLPYKVAFIVSTAVRFIPSISEETRTVLTAMRMRGFPLRPSRPWQYIRALYRAMPPVLFRNIRRAAMLSDSIDCKGFAIRDIGIEATNSEQDSMLGKAILSLVVLVVLLLAVAKLFTFLAFNGFAHFVFLEDLYAFVESYL